MTTLKEALQSLSYLRILPKPKRRIAEGLLGQYKGIVPKGKSSCEWLREKRAKLYGKVN